MLSLFLRIDVSQSLGQFFWRKYLQNVHYQKVQKYMFKIIILKDITF
jgi:hypothetical protein